MTKDKYQAYLLSERWRRYRAYKLVTAILGANDAGSEMLKANLQFCRRLLNLVDPFPQYLSVPCDDCGLRFPASDINLHHVSYARLGAELLKDTLVICESCHAIRHGLPEVPAVKSRGNRKVDVRKQGAAQ